LVLMRCERFSDDTRNLGLSKAIGAAADKLKRGDRFPLSRPDDC
jgi:hypothetical protein